MATDAKSIINLPVVYTLASNDVIVCVSNTASNGGNVSVISVDSLFDNVGAFSTQQNDYTHGNTWSGPVGVLFFSNTYGYISIAANTLARFPLTTGF